MPQLMKAIKDSSTGVKPSQGIDPLWPALLQFLQEGLQRAGTMAGNASNRYSDIVERIAAGKPMNAPGETAQLGGLVNPIAGVIKPETWKSMQPVAQKLMKTFQERFPDVFEKVQQNPVPLLPTVGPQRNSAYGTLAMHTPSPKIASKATSGMIDETPIKAVLGVDPSKGQTLETILHEAQHYLNFPRVAGTDPADASTIGLLLSELLPVTERGSLNMRMGQFQDVMAPQISAPMKDALAEVQHYGQGMYQPTPQGMAPAAGTGYYKPGETLNDFYQRGMMDEGLAYLAEQSAKQPNQLARQLGIGTEHPLPQQMQQPAQAPAPAPAGGNINWDELLNSLGFGQ